MKYLFFLIFFVLVSCNHITTTKTLKTETFEFNHATKVQQLAIELKEVRNSDRDPSRLFTRNVTFDYKLVVEWRGSGKSVNLLEIPWEKERELSDFTHQIEVKRAKNRRHFALGYDNYLFAIGNVFSGESFIRNCSLDSNFSQYGTNLDAFSFEKLPSVRKDLMAHLGGDRKLPYLGGEQFASILLKLPPGDELNQELILALAEDREIDIHGVALTTLIESHCKSADWKNKAYKAVKKYRNLENPSDWISKLSLLGGQKAIDEEDWIQLNLLSKSYDIRYFEIRNNSDKFPLNSNVKKKLIETEKSILKNPCINKKQQRISFLNHIRFLENLTNQAAFNYFVTNYEKSGCISQTIEIFHSDFLFLADNISAKEKRRWLEVVIKNFQLFPTSKRTSVYKDLEKTMTCQQKRDLITKYRKDIDAEILIPVCN